MPIDFDCSIESCSSSSPPTYSCQSMSQLFGPSKKPSSVTIFHMMSFLIVRIRPPIHRGWRNEGTERESNPSLPPRGGHNAGVRPYTTFPFLLSESPCRQFV